MLNQKFIDMCGQKSVIRELFAYGSERAKEIGYENVFDYSLGNPSVPAPESFTQEMIRLLQTENPLTLHGYSQSLGIDSVREAVAVSLNDRFDMNYKKEDVFMVSGAAGAIAHAARAVTVPGDEILAVNPADADSGIVSLVFTIDESAIRYAGTYTGRVIFTIAVNPAENNEILKGR